MPELTLTSTLCPLQSRLQHIYHGQPYASVDPNPMPESTLSPSQALDYFAVTRFLNDAGLEAKLPRLSLAHFL
jgi:hypothetical protein